jgi:excisionase family DNA binding protein
MATGMLTAQQVQDLLDVDASTVYRMAGDGRLPAVRIGRQWRFPAEAIEQLLVPSGVAAAAPAAASARLLPAAAAHPVTAPAAGAPSTPPVTTVATSTSPTTAARSAAAPQAVVPSATDADPLVLAQDLLETVATALGVTMVVTDLEGRAVLPVVNPAPALVQLLDDPAFTAACTIEWRDFAHEPLLAPRFQLGRHGFLCAHSLVRDGTTLVAMVLAGGIAPDAAHDPDLFHLDADQRRRVLETLPRTAALLSRLAAFRRAG